MGTINYSQVSISVLDQIQLLKDEGLTFNDEPKATHLLGNISFFRMKNYLRPLQISNKRQFRQGATFEQAYELYKFDAELRKMICSEMEKIEVSIRTQLSLVMSDGAGSFWFYDASNFRSSSRHTDILDNLKAELRRSDDEQILDFWNKYFNPFPPSWMTMEVSSFGTLSIMYKWINNGHAKRNVARFYGLSDTVLESWLHSMVYIRNICAHHSRLWNRVLSIQPLQPRSARLPFISIPAHNKRVYYILCILLYFLQTVNPKNTFAFRFKELLRKYPGVDIYAMGAPHNWENEILWRSENN